MGSPHVYNPCIVKVADDKSQDGKEYGTDYAVDLVACIGCDEGDKRVEAKGFAHNLWLD